MGWFCFWDLIKGLINSTLFFTLAVPNKSLDLTPGISIEGKLKTPSLFSQKTTQLN